MGKHSVHNIGNDTVITEAGSKSMATILGANIITSSPDTPAVPKPNDAKDSKSITDTKIWRSWGDDDSWPDLLQELLLKLGVARAALDINSDFHFGQGIHWVNTISNEDGTVKHIIKNPEGWRSWAYTSGFYSALSDDINSRDTFGISIIRFRLTKEGRVYSMDVLDTPSCRLGKRNTQGFIEQVYYAHEIKDRSSEDTDVIKLNVYDPEKHEEFIKKNKTFVVINSIRTWGRFYYPEPNYYATVRNGWTDIALEVPKLIKNIYKNQATLKYHIKIPYQNLVIKYKCFDEKTEQEQLSLVAAYKSEIDSVIAGAEAAGKSIFTLYNANEPTVEILPIKDAIDNTKDLPNNVAANSEILFAIGVAPSILGLNMPGGKDLNGSGGSQLRESIKAKQATLTRERIKSLELCYLVRKLNGYDESIDPMFIDIDVSQTLDENPTGKTTVVKG